MPLNGNGFVLVSVLVNTLLCKLTHAFNTEIFFSFENEKKII